ncbi:hypothetical protein LEP3755_66550 (plasmid) [Leptolyngbya sp. NIES-3755]|nr:hypothetical protein LEP3755_66550 [Leptolyngbya sp. NIES-3755]
MLNLKSWFLLPFIVAASCTTVAAHPSPELQSCPDSDRPVEQANLQVKQRANQLQRDRSEFFGQKVIDSVSDRRITLTTAFDSLSGQDKRQVLRTLKLEGSTYEVYSADARLVSTQYDRCTHTYLLSERDRFRWYYTRNPIQLPTIEQLNEALRNAGRPSWRKVNQSISPENERRARVKFWQAIGYDKVNQGWWIAWVPEGGYFEINIRSTDSLARVKPYLATAFRQYRYVVVHTDGTPLYDTAVLGNPWMLLLGKTSAPAGWRVGACDRDGSLLCVDRAQTRLGSIELQRWRYSDDKLLLLAREFDQYGLVPGLFTYANSRDKENVLTALRAVIADDYKTIERERTSKYGKGYRIQIQPPEEVKFGSVPGLRYGFQGIDAAGRVREKSVSYMAFEGEELKIVRTGFDPSAQSSVFRELANLEQFEPHLRTIVENLK